LNIQEINKSGEDDAGPVQKIPEKDREIDNKLPAEENSPLCDDDRASLLVLQNLDKVLNNECVNDVNTPEGETSDAITSFPDDQEKSKYHLQVFFHDHEYCAHVPHNHTSITLRIYRLCSSSVYHALMQ
jgi:hypothetical protein